MPGANPRIHTRWALAVVGCAALAAGMLAGLVVLMSQLSWVNQAEPGDPEWGISFSCRHAAYLFEAEGAPQPGDAGYVDWCSATFDEVITSLGARHVRLSAFWNEIEPAPGEYDFSTLDPLLDIAEERGVSVSLTVGIRSQRHPEYYIPAWVLEQPPTDPEAREKHGTITDDAAITEPALRMVAAVVRHTASREGIDSWQAENEPFTASNRASLWTMDPEFVAEEIEVIRANDPAGRPVVVNHGGHWSFDDRWEEGARLGDVYGQSVYPFRRWGIPHREWTFSILEFGPITPNYPDRARDLRETGTQFWITELQAEPWALYDGDLEAEEPPGFSPDHFRQNLDYARRSGATIVYLWGAEWWYMRAEKLGDWRYWEIAREVMAEGSGGMAGSVR